MQVSNTDIEYRCRMQVSNIGVEYRCRIQVSNTGVESRGDRGKDLAILNRKLEFSRKLKVKNT